MVLRDSTRVLMNEMHKYKRYCNGICRLGSATLLSLPVLTTTTKRLVTTLSYSRNTSSFLISHAKNYFGTSTPNKLFPSSTKTLHSSKYRLLNKTKRKN